MYPEPTVGALVFRDGKLFLMKSPKWHGKFTVPGGHVELGEKLEEALKREIKEETNMEISDIAFLQVQEFIFGEEFTKKKHFIFLDYVCQGRGEVVLNNEGTEYVWVNPEKALELDLEPYTRETIEFFLKQARTQNISHESSLRSA